MREEKYGILISKRECVVRFCQQGVRFVLVMGMQAGSLVDQALISKSSSYLLILMIY